jgi:hypothetical protein
MKNLIMTMLMLSLAFAACNREVPNPLENPSGPDLPPTPTNLAIFTADRELELTWSVSDSAGISMYHIYSSDSLNGEYGLFDSTETTEYTATNLMNGRAYFYKVSVVNTEGIEGRLSSGIYGVPGLYSLIINDGLERTEDRHVTLNVVAPIGTSLMRISNTADFAQASWEPFIDTRNWLLTEGSGEKTVYALFRDVDGNSIRDTVFDKILFEVFPYQYSVTINGGVDKAYSRDVNLSIGAPQSTSFMMISNEANFADAQWEAYASSRSWHIENETASNGENVGFFVLFRDSNGDSVEVMASDSIILAAADPVELYPVYQPEDSYQSISLNWSRSMSGDFYSYRVFRSRGTSSVDTMITTLFDPDQVSYTDNLNIMDFPVDSPELVFYKVRFYSVYQDSSDSDVIQVTLVNNRPPTLAAFVHDINYDIDTLTGVDLQATFGWERSDIIDYDSYVVYEGTSMDTSEADPVFYSYDQGTLAYDINKTNVDSLEVYYYWVRVFDLGGAASQFSAPDSVYY